MNEFEAEKIEPQGFHAELQALLLAETESEARGLLLAAMGRRRGAGAVFIGHSVTPGEPPMMRGIWAETIWPLPDGKTIGDMVGPIAKGMPRRLNSWFAKRADPVTLSGITRFIPYSSRLILKIGSPKGVPALRDVVWAPYNHRGHQYCFIVGLFQTATTELLDEIVSLALTYTVKWINRIIEDDQIPGSSGGPRMELSERELDCLRWLVAGKTLQDIADIMDMSYANVRYHLDKAKTRHGYATVQQLMVHAAVEYSLSPHGPEPGTTRH